MKAFDLARAHDAAEAIAAIGDDGEHRFLAGGTTLLDLMKCGVERPAKLVDIGSLSVHSAIGATDEHLRIGALARMSRVARNEAVRQYCPAVAEALWQAASPQIRNMATIGGNLMQRTRCAYFRDPKAFPACNKRERGSGCSAIGGVTRGHAVLGTSAHCIATYPGDLAVALMAFDARLLIEGAAGSRTVDIGDFFLLPGDTPDIEHPLAPGELIVEVELPLSTAAARSTYLKVRDRQSYEFAVASAAVGVALEADGRTVADVRIALGGVATIPWRARMAEAALIGKPLDEPTIRAASELASSGAEPSGENFFKAALIQRVVSRALITVMDLPE